MKRKIILFVFRSLSNISVPALFIIHYSLIIVLFSSCVKWSGESSSAPPSSPEDAANEVTDSIKVKVASFNVNSGRLATPEKIAKVFLPLNCDVICFNEMPGGDWIERVSKILGMDYFFTGLVSSGNEKDKFKAILSKTPITGVNEFMLNSGGWHPASIIKGDIYIDENKFIILSLQIAGSNGGKDSYAALTANILGRFKDERVIVAGDFNNMLKDSAMDVFRNIKAEDLKYDNVWDNLKIDPAKDYTYGVTDKENKGITDHILYSNGNLAYTITGGYLDIKPAISNHKPIWAILEFPPPKLKKNNDEEN